MPVRVTVSMPDDLDAAIREQLEYGDSYSAVVADALRDQLEESA